MSSSPRGGRVRSPSGWLAADQPVDALTARHVIFGNANHHADSVAKVHANWVSPIQASLNSQPRVDVRPIGSSIAADTWMRLVILGPFNLSLMPDHASYKLRMRVLGASTGGHLCEFAIALGRPSEIADLEAGFGRSSVLCGSTTSATPAWLTPSPEAIELAAETVDDFVAERRALLDTGAGATSVLCAEVSATIYGRTANVLSLPALYGIHIAEFAP